jgi:hypothetical protein
MAAVTGSHDVMLLVCIPLAQILSTRRLQPFLLPERTMPIAGMN